jgi:uncharacterized protein YprB with RNaseH-like and TPR domain
MGPLKIAFEINIFDLHHLKLFNMIENIKKEQVLFLDIETVPAASSYELLTETEKHFWDRKAELLKKQPDDSPASLYPRAGIYAEFGKIICISTGYFSKDGKFRLKSFAGDDESALLSTFSDLLITYFNKPDYRLCAHNGKEFDFPFIARRMLIQGIKLPSALDLASKKPWEVPHLDTMELWKFGDYKNFTPLNLMAHLFGIPSPKDDIDGSQVWSVYWNEKNLPRIVTYCQKDVVTIAQIFLKLRREELLATGDIIFVEENPADRVIM